MKLLLDMNLTPRWVEFLQASSFQALHWSSVRPADAPDEEIMQYAADHGFIVVTHDLDFSAILAATKGDKPSVVQLRAKNITPEAVGAIIIAALRHSVQDLEPGAVLTIDADRTRIRLLPLNP